jgi:hypothetical protein
MFGRSIPVQFKWVPVLLSFDNAHGGHGGHGAQQKIIKYAFVRAVRQESDHSTSHASRSRRFSAAAGTSLCCFDAAVIEHPSMFIAKQKHKAQRIVEITPSAHCQLESHIVGFRNFATQSNIRFHSRCF